MNQERFNNLLTNKLRFCPHCNRYTIQQKILNEKNEFCCVVCNNIFKATEPIVPEYNNDLDIAIRDELPIADEFDGWEAEELKSEISRLQDILDKHHIKY